MHNLKFYALPIKSLNNIMKYKLQETNEGFTFDSKGILYNGIYYDFRVTRIVDKYEPQLYENRYNSIIHINQIDINQSILLCIILGDKIICYLIDEQFYNTYKNIMSPQHKGNYYQLHTTYDIIDQNCKCIFFTEKSL